MTMLWVCYGLSITASKSGIMHMLFLTRTASGGNFGSNTRGTLSSAGYLRCEHFLKLGII